MLWRFCRSDDKAMDLSGTTCRPQFTRTYAWHSTKNLPTHRITYPTQQGQHKRHTKLSRIPGSATDSSSSPMIIDNMQSKNKPSQKICLNLSGRKRTGRKDSRNIEPWIYGISHVPVWQDHRANQRADKIVIKRGLWYQISHIKILQKYIVRHATRRQWKNSMATRTNSSVDLWPNEKMWHLQGWMQEVDEERRFVKDMDNLKTHFTEA